jgi:hypothetical protein
MKILNYFEITLHKGIKYKLTISLYYILCVMTSYMYMYAIKGSHKFHFFASN